MTGGSRAIAAGENLHFVHAFGETTLSKPAQRVISLGYTTQDPLLALGVRPVAIRQWFGSFPYGVWPWAQPLLGDAKPAMISGEVSMELVASLAPDLIVGIGSGISEAEYAVLSQIAPVLMQPAGLPAYGMPWDELTLMLGRAVGKAALAEELVAASRQKFADARQRHPDWTGKTAVCAYNYGGETGAFSGFFGIGGGFLIVPGLIAATNMAMINAVGTSLVAVTSFGLTTALNYAASGLVNWPLAGVFVVGGFLGSLAGTRTAKKLSSSGQLVTVFAILIFVVAAYMLYKSGVAVFG